MARRSKDIRRPQPKKAETPGAREGKIRARIQELIRDGMTVLQAGEDELLDLCQNHRATFSEEYVTSWPDAEGDDRLFRRTREEFTQRRIDPAKFNLFCIHETSRFPRDSEAFFRLLWIARQNVPRSFYTDAEHAWMEKNYDRLQARGGDGRDLGVVKERHAYAGIGLTYAEQVVAGKIPACLQVRQACQRQIDDLKRSGQYPTESKRGMKRKRNGRNETN